jgi:hypothetical protein
MSVGPPAAIPTPDTASAHPAEQRDSPVHPLSAPSNQSGLPFTKTRSQPSTPHALKLAAPGIDDIASSSGEGPPG